MVMLMLVVEMPSEVVNQLLISTLWYEGGEDDAGVDAAAQQVNNVIDGFQYTETQIG